MGIVHQENYWIKSLNVLENVAMPLYLTGSKRESAFIVAKESLEKVGMSDYASYLPTVLSGGTAATSVYGPRARSQPKTYTG